MATVSELVDLLIAVLPEENPADIRHRARRLREEGLLPQKGRGTSAAQIADEHAARLLLAVLAGGPAIHSADAVRQIEALESSNHAWTREGAIEQLSGSGNQLEDKTVVAALVWLMQLGRDPERLATRRYFLTDIAVHYQSSSWQFALRFGDLDADPVKYETEQFGARPSAADDFRHAITRSNSVTGAIVGQLAALVGGHPDPIHANQEE